MSILPTLLDKWHTNGYNIAISHQGGHDDSNDKGFSTLQRELQEPVWVSTGYGNISKPDLPCTARQAPHQPKIHCRGNKSLPQPQARWFVLSRLWVANCQQPLPSVFSNTFHRQTSRQRETTNEKHTISAGEVRLIYQGVKCPPSRSSLKGWWEILF